MAAVPERLSLVPPLPADLQSLVRRGDLAYERLNVKQVDYLVVGGRAPGSQAELYLFFSERRLRHDLTQLGAVLAYQGSPSSAS